MVAAEVATALGMPLCAAVARKIGAPGHGELAIGAVGPDASVRIDERLARLTGATEQYLEGAIATARAAVEERVASLPGVAIADDVAGGVVIVVDDGVATGATASAVGQWLGHAGAKRRILALPVGPPDTLVRLGSDYDEVLVLLRPPDFTSVGQWYADFAQTTDEEVASLLGATE